MGGAPFFSSFQKLLICGKNKILPVSSLLKKHHIGACKRTTEKNIYFLF